MKKEAKLPAGAPEVEKGAALRSGMAAARLAAAAAVVVPATETRNVSFVTRKRMASPWVLILDRLGDLKLGEALRLNVPTVPASLLTLARKREIKIEFSECGDHVLIREKGMGAPE